MSVENLRLCFAIERLIQGGRLPPMLVSGFIEPLQAVLGADRVSVVTVDQYISPQHQRITAAIGQGVATCVVANIGDQLRGVPFDCANRTCVFDQIRDPDYLLARVSVRIRMSVRPP